MHVPLGGGPDPHRHACEEMFLVVAGEIKVFFRDRKLVLAAGEAVNVPANARHMFKNRGDVSARVLNVFVPAGLDAFFAEGGVQVATTAAPPLPTAQAEDQKRRMTEIAPGYGVEFLPSDTFKSVGE